MFIQKYIRILAVVLMVSASLLVASCGGEQQPQDDVVRKATGSSNKQGLWRMIEEFDGETFYSTLLVQGTGSSVTMTDCSRAFEVDSMQLNGSSYSGYNHDLAPLQVINNDTLRWSYTNQTRQFEKMDVHSQFNMGEFSLSSPLLPDVDASNLVCVQFSETDQGEVLVLTTQVLGHPLLVTINMKNGLVEGTHNVDPYGNERAMVIFSGSHWANTTLTAYDEISSGSVTISSRGNVWIEGEVQGVLRNGITPIHVAFNVETPVN
jgi:hypothetical protein